MLADWPTTQIRQDCASCSMSFWPARATTAKQPLQAQAPPSHTFWYARRCVAMRGVSVSNRESRCVARLIFTGRYATGNTQTSAIGGTDTHCSKATQTATSRCVCTTKSTWQVVDQCAGGHNYCLCRRFINTIEYTNVTSGYRNQSNGCCCIATEQQCQQQQCRYDAAIICAPTTLPVIAGRQ
jgi:hypothetical protein